MVFVGVLQAETHLEGTLVSNGDVLDGFGGGGGICRWRRNYGARFDAAATAQAWGVGQFEGAGVQGEETLQGQGRVMEETINGEGGGVKHWVSMDSGVQYIEYLAEQAGISKDKTDIVEKREGPAC